MRKVKPLHVVLTTTLVFSPIIGGIHAHNVLAKNITNQPLIATKETTKSIKIIGTLEKLFPDKNFRKAVMTGYHDVTKQILPEHVSQSMLDKVHVVASYSEPITSTKGIELLRNLVRL